MHILAEEESLFAIIQVMVNAYIYKPRNVLPKKKNLGAHDAIDVASIDFRMNFYARENAKRRHKINSRMFLNLIFF